MVHPALIVFWSMSASDDSDKLEILNSRLDPIQQHGSLSFVLLKAQGVGVNYRLLGDNLPVPEAAIGLLKSRNITKVWIFEPNPVT
ncbi:putative glucan endo-1 [Quercus suber]|uniref:Glucan endo-1 n=1 Tax=Quercus suber TaxID=58331 RepID=A0AAW0MA84_QUESU